MEPNFELHSYILEAIKEYLSRYNFKETLRSLEVIYI